MTVLPAPWDLIAPVAVLAGLYVGFWLIAKDGWKMQQEQTTVAGLVEPPDLGRYIAWLYDDTPQPDGAMIMHHGLYVASEQPRLQGWSVTPRGFEKRPVVVFNARTSYDRVADTWEGLWTADEVDALRAMVARHADIEREWNGAGAPSVSFQLARPSAGPVGNLVETYLAGCPEHSTVFCSSRGCDWWPRGRGLARTPERTAA